MGRRWNQTVTAGSGPQPSLSFNTANNKIASSGYTYDAAGNMTSDGTHTYTYDAEGNITAVDNGATATYVYDALNHRVRTVANGATTEFVFNQNGQRVSVWNGATKTVLREQYYWGAKPVAFYANSATHFQHQDWLGTERARTTYTGAIEGTYASLPFGDAYAASGSDQDQYHYAQLDYDTETNTDHAQFRQYSSSQGRWMRPDPYFGSYILRSPQSLNRYSYALNNPLGLIDPLGLDVICYSGADDTENADGSYGVTGYNGYCEEYGDPGGGGGGGGGGSTSSSVTQAACASIPSGRVIGFTGAAGPGIGSGTVGGEVVLNYNSGQTSLFGFAGIEVGWNGFGSASLYTGFAYGLNNSNSNYSGGFTAVTASGPIIGGTVARSSGGMTGGAAGVLPSPIGTSGSVTTGVVSIGVGTSPITGNVSLTNYSNPIQLAKFTGFTLADFGLYAARQACIAAGF